MTADTDTLAQAAERASASSPTRAAGGGGQGEAFAAGRASCLLSNN